MKCPVCKIEMKRKTETAWECRNPKCIMYGKEQSNADER
jgi:ribosomal protein L37AE/L43A